MLAPYLAQLSFSAVFDLWEIREEADCTREGLALTVAADEMACGDFAAAYGVLLDVEATDRVAALRALVALELEWWQRALGAARFEGASTRWQPWLDLAAGTAHARLGRLDEAAHCLDRAVTQMAATYSPADEGALNRAQLERAQVRAKQGDSSGAWQDLTAVLRDRKSVV